MPAASFGGMRVLALESRRATELATLIRTYGGNPVVVPALRELPLESNVAALDFAAGLLLGDFDIVVFLTGVGARALVEVMEKAHPGREVLAALGRTNVAVRGPKPAAVLREMNVPIWVTTPEPNTWRELLAAMESRAAERPIDGARIAVQEYGVPNVELIQALTDRGASVLPVPIYRWSLPDDLSALRGAVAAIAGGGIDVLLLTSGVQLDHLWQVVTMMGCEAEFRRGLSDTTIASIGPTCSGEIRRRNLTPHIQASHPKLGYLVREAAGQAEEIRARRSGQQARS
jgi:uroporphyrinogen-III synthase